MNNEPVAWIDPKELDMAVSTSVTKNKQFDGDIPLYTHPHPDNLGLAESIIKQQKLEIDALHNLVKEQDKKIIDLAFEKVYAEKSAEVLSELYTHPVKELTEWEMKECWEEATEGREHFCSQYFDFAQLILRKAQK